MAKSNWLEEAKKSRAIMYAKWQSEKQPMGDFYKWLLEQVETKIASNRLKEASELDRAFRNTV